MKNKEDIRSYISQRTTCTKDFLTRAVIYAQTIQKDPEKEDRLRHQQCRFCHYTPTLVRPASASYNCRICEIELLHGDRNVPHLCMRCAIEHHLCIHCGAELDVRPGKDHEKNDE